MSRKITEEEAREWLKKNRPEIELVEWGGSGVKKSVFRCGVDENVWEQTFSKIKSLSIGCPVCAHRSCGEQLQLSVDDVRHRWVVTGRTDLIFKGEKKQLNNNCLWLWECISCGREKWGSIGNIINKGGRCTFCFGSRNRITENEAKIWLMSYAPDIELVKWGGKSCRIKSRFKCKIDGYEWESTFDNIKQGSGCPKCSNHVYLTENDVCLWLKENKPDIELMQYGGGASKVSVFRCKIDGHEWRSTFCAVRTWYSCPKCAGVAKLTRKEVVEWLKVYKPYIVLKRYGGKASCVSLFRCKKCGKVWETTFSALKHSLQDNGCPGCASNGILSRDNAVKWLNKYKPEINLIKYGGSSGSSESIFECAVCKYKWKTSFSSIKNQGTGCRSCGHIRAGEKRKTSEASIREWLKTHRIDIELIRYGGGADTKSLFVCNKCGYRWVASFCCIKNQGTGCPNCTLRNSHTYFYNNERFDSSWEIITYFYYKEIKHSDIKRLRVGGDEYLLYDYEGRRHKWYPDFKIGDLFIEVKPENGGPTSDAKAKTKAKKAMGYPVMWIGEDDIDRMKQELEIAGIDIEQYRINIDSKQTTYQKELEYDKA